MIDADLNKAVNTAYARGHKWVARNIAGTLGTSPEKRFISESGLIVDSRGNSGDCCQWIHHLSRGESIAFSVKE